MLYKWPSERQTRVHGSIFPKHVRVPSICETMGLCLILHSKLETGKCDHDSTFKIHSPPCQGIIWALFEKGKNYKSIFLLVKVGSSTWFERKKSQMGREARTRPASPLWMVRAHFCFPVTGGFQAMRGWRASVEVAWVPAGIGQLHRMQ